MTRPSTDSISRPAGLPPERLRIRLRPQDIAFEDSDAAPDPGSCAPSQPRALEAMNLAVHIPGLEFNVFLAGDEGTGRTHFAREVLGPVAAAMAVPPDVCYVSGFEDHDRPRCLRLPAGMGRKLASDVAEAVAAVRETIPRKLEEEAFLSRQDRLSREFQDSRDDLFSRMEDTASSHGFALSQDDSGGLTLMPVREGRVLSQAEFEALSGEEHRRLRSERDAILSTLTGYMRQIGRKERGLREEQNRVEREFASRVVQECLKPLHVRYRGRDGVKEFLEAMAEDMLANLPEFLPLVQPGFPGSGPGSGQAAGHGSGQAAGHGSGQAPGQTQSAAMHPHQEHGPGEDFFARYSVNVLVDHDGTTGAPVVMEDHPTFFNLLGCVERESEFGGTYTDFTLIKPGALHRAAGGFLILSAEEVLAAPHTWDGLLRALRSGRVRIEDPSESGEQVKTRSIDPEPLPLEVKIVLTGTDETYETLLTHDTRFRKFFKIKAHLQDEVERTPESVERYLADLCRMARRAELRPFDREALAGLVDHASRLCADQKRISLRMPALRELMVEADAMARMAGERRVTGAVLDRALAARDHRANLYEDEFLSDYDREIIKVATDGLAVGRVNGLSVTYYGDYVFGLPYQIACTVGVGAGGIVDLEREAELGGPIHTKAMMILKSCLLGRFAHDKPLILSGSLYFEQSYAEVEGDSASGAELAALLSALSGVPVDLSLAFTGAVNQSGAIMAVGDPTRKIEGFFEVCRRRGLTGRQGVLVPVDNVDNLMLRRDVVEAVEQGRFSVHPVATIEEAMELLTGMAAGERGPDGLFPEQSLYGLVDARLAELARIAARYGLGASSERPSGA